MADDHKCTKGKTGDILKNNGKRGSALGFKNPFKNVGFRSKRGKGKTKKLDPFKQIMRMKSVAIGNNNIDIKDRFYMEILFSDKLKNKKLKSITMFFNKNKTVGRILDEICDKKKIRNNNHLPNKRKIVVYCKRTNGILPNDIKLELMEPEFMSGDTIIIKYEDE